MSRLCTTTYPLSDSASRTCAAPVRLRRRAGSAPRPVRTCLFLFHAPGISARAMTSARSVMCQPCRRYAGAGQQTVLRRVARSGSFRGDPLNACTSGQSAGGAGRTHRLRQPARPPRRCGVPGASRLQRSSPPRSDGGCVLAAREDSLSCERGDSGEHMAHRDDVPSVPGLAPGPGTPLISSTRDGPRSWSARTTCAKSCGSALTPSHGVATE